MLSAVRQQAEHKRVLAAVAYVGDGADHLLPLKAGDTVVVNGSRNALASGATSARILREWYEQGVEVYSHPTLHAKVFVIGRTAIVGSANLSQRASFDNTAEAAIQTTDRAIVGQARDFVKRMEDDATNVDETWLKMAGKVPVAKSRCPPGTPLHPSHRTDPTTSGSCHGKTPTSPRTK